VRKNADPFSQQFDKVSFYIIAHADDWQLFMYPHVYNDLTAPACKVIFILTTAGDAGMEDKFWRSREEGTKSSVRYCLAPFSLLSEFGGNRVFTDHPVHYWSINNTTSYFLRLPDGGLQGNGHDVCNFQCLPKFWSSQINSITSIDDTTTYHNWSSFVSTIESIIHFETGGIGNSWVHYLNPDTTVNPNDHPDHIATGHAIQQVTLIQAMHKVLFVGYSSCAAGKQLPSSDVFHKSGMFAAYEKAVYDGCGYSTLAENAELYARWCSSEPQFIAIAPTKS